MTPYTVVVILICCLLAYLAGAIPFGLLLGKLFGLGDIRKIGSGNIGATNMMRTGRKGLAALTLLLDFAKGLLAVPMAQGLCLYFYGRQGDFTVHPDIRCLAGVAAVIGHVFPFWLGFKGGKGVATTLGVFFAIDPRMGTLACLGWVVFFYLTRISSLAAIGTLASMPVLAYMYSTPYFTAMATALAILVITKHKENIKRLRAGNEMKWNKKNDSA